MAIQNIVFDLGNVLLDFDPAAYLRSFGCDDVTVQMLLRTAFVEDWPHYDRGDYATVDELRAALCKKYPAYAQVLQQALQPDWVKIHTLRQDTVDYLLALKRRGYRVYLLSNFAKESYDYLSQLAFFNAVDGGVFSYQERVCKPEERIYRILLERYGLAPQETVFLDDLAVNIAAANAVGIHGVVFTDLPAAKAQVEALLADDAPLTTQSAPCKAF